MRPSTEACRAVAKRIDAQGLAGDHPGHEPRARRAAGHAEVAVAEGEVEPLAAGRLAEHRQAVRGRGPKAHPELRLGISHAYWFGWWAEMVLVGAAGRPMSS